MKWNSHMSTNISIWIILIIENHTFLILGKLNLFNLWIPLYLTFEHHLRLNWLSISFYRVKWKWGFFDIWNPRNGLVCLLLSSHWALFYSKVKRTFRKLIKFPEFPSFINTKSLNSQGNKTIVNKYLLYSVG